MKQKKLNQEETAEEFFDRWVKDAKDEEIKGLKATTNMLTPEETGKYYFDQVILKVDNTIEVLKDTDSKQLSTLKKASEILHSSRTWKKEDRVIENNNDWEGLLNILEGLKFDENDFTDSVLYSFIHRNYQNFNIQELQYTREIEEFQNALENVLDYVKKEDEFSRILNLIKDKVLTKNQRVELFFEEVIRDVNLEIERLNSVDSNGKQALIKVLNMLLKTQPFNQLKFRINKIFFPEYYNLKKC